MAYGATVYAAQQLRAAMLTRGNHATEVVANTGGGVVSWRTLVCGSRHEPARLLPRLTPSHELTEVRFIDSQELVSLPVRDSVRIRLRHHASSAPLRTLVEPLMRSRPEAVTVDPLAEMIAILQKAFPDGLNDGEYFGILAALYEDMSDENLARVVA